MPEEKSAPTRSDGPAAPIRVAHLITSLDQNGAQFALARLTRSLAGPQFEHSVISIAPIKQGASVTFSEGVSISSLNMSPRRPNPIALIRLIARLRAYRPHIFQTWLYHADALGCLAKPMVDTQLIWNIRCSDMASDYGTPAKRLLLGFLKSASRVPELVVANSQQGISHHKSAGYRSPNWAHVPNGFDLEEFQPNNEERIAARATLGLDPKDLAVGIAARFHEMKDYPTFLRAAGLTATMLDRARFVVFGDGHQQETEVLKNLSHELGIGDKMIWAGHWRAMPSAYNSLDLLVMSSRYGEGFPNSVGEAMACGVPVVVTDVGDAATLVADIDRVVVPGNPEALAASMQAVLSLPADTRIALGENDRARIASQYSDAAVAARYSEIYRGLAAPDP
jgi:glycosyltransferase involved in cell wall biosynthesis